MSNKISKELNKMNRIVLSVIKALGSCFDNVVISQTLVGFSDDEFELCISCEADNLSLNITCSDYSSDWCIVCYLDSIINATNEYLENMDYLDDEQFTEISILEMFERIISSLKKKNM